MKTLRIVPLLLLMSFLCSAQKIKLTFDYNQANLIVRALENADNINEELELSLKKDYATPLLLKRVQVRNKFVDFDTLIHDLKAVSAGKKLGREDYFRLQVAKRDLQKTVSLLSMIKENENVIKQEIEEKLSPYVSSGSINIDVHFIMLGASFGFAPNEKNFCVGLHWYEGDLTGVKWVMVHEIFHNIQALYYPNQKIEKIEKSLSKNEKLLYSYLVSTYKEGTATFVSDVVDYPSEYTKQHKKRQETAERIIGDHFLLFETIIYRLYNDKKFQNEDLIYNIGSNWDWGNPNYYVGYTMCKALEKYRGKDYLKKSLAKDPVDFFIDYIEVSSANKNDKDIIQLSADVQSILKSFALERVGK